jgi:tetratricopeptide (TPR) repeat protein
MKNRTIWLFSSITLSLLATSPCWAEIPTPNSGNSEPDSQSAPRPELNPLPPMVLTAPEKKVEKENGKYKLNADAPVVKDDDPSCICHEASREYNLGHYEKAAELYSRYVKQLEVSEGPNGLDVGTMLQNVGDCYDHLSRYDEAMTAYSRGLNILKERKAQNPGDYARLLTCVGGHYCDLKKFDQSIATIKEAITVLEPVPSEGKHLAHSIYMLAYTYAEMGQTDKAQSNYQKALDLREKLKIKDQETAAIMAELGKISDRSKDYPKALSLLEPRLTIVKGLFKPNTSQMVDAIMDLGNAYKDSGNPNKQLDLYQQYASEAKTASCANDPIAFTVYREAADALLDKGRFAEADQYYEQILSVEKDGKYYANDLDGYAVTLFKTGQYDKAEVICKRIITVIASEKIVDHQKLGSAYKNYAKLLRVTNREKQAEEVERLAHN